MSSNPNFIIFTKISKDIETKNFLLKIQNIVEENFLSDFDDKKLMYNDLIRSNTKFLPKKLKKSKTYLICFRRNTADYPEQINICENFIDEHFQKNEVISFSNIYFKIPS